MCISMVDVIMALPILIILAFLTKELMWMFSRENLHQMSVIYVVIVVLWALISMIYFSEVRQ